MIARQPLQQVVAVWDDDKTKIKIARYQGEVLNLTVAKGCATVGTSRYYISNNFPDGTILQVNVIESRRKGVFPSLLVRDVLKYGKDDLSEMSFRARFELLDLLCTTFGDEYGFKIFGGRCVSPHVYVALPITFSLAYKCSDERLVGVTAFPDCVDIAKSSVNDDVDGIDSFPPVEDESKRVASYKQMIQAMIRKMGGKWKDVYLKKHTPGQLPFSADDLMQQGLMEVTIAIRKYNSKHTSKAKESTFVYRHLWNRFGHIAHKYSKKSRGYGVPILRDTIDDDGNITTPYELGNESRSHGYGYTDSDGE